LHVALVSSIPVVALILIFVDVAGAVISALAPNVSVAYGVKIKGLVAAVMFALAPNDSVA